MRKNKKYLKLLGKNIKDTARIEELVYLINDIRFVLRGLFFDEKVDEVKK